MIFFRTFILFLMGEKMLSLVFLQLGWHSTTAPAPEPITTFSTPIGANDLGGLG